MKAFLELYKKEFKSLYSLGIIIIGSVFILQLLFFVFVYRGGYIGIDDVFPLIFLLYLGIVLFYPILIFKVGSTKSLKKECERDTIYFILSLPRRGWQLILVKFISLFSWNLLAPIINGFTLLVLSRIFISGMNFRVLINKVIDLFDKGGFMGEIIVVIFIVYGISILIYFVEQFSFLLSTFFNNEKIKRLISFVVFFQVIYCLYRLNYVLRIVFDRLNLNFTILISREGVLFNTFDFLPVITCLLGVMLLFAGSSFLIEKHMEV